MGPAPRRKQTDGHPDAARTAEDLLCLENQLRTAKDFPQVFDEERQQRLERIKRTLADGTYKIDPATLTKAILRRDLP